MTYPVFVQRNWKFTIHSSQGWTVQSTISLEEEVGALNCSTTLTKRNKRSIVAVTCYFCVARYLATMDENLIWLKLKKAKSLPSCILCIIFPPKTAAYTNQGAAYILGHINYKTKVIDFVARRALVLSDYNRWQ